MEILVAEIYSCQWLRFRIVFAAQSHGLSLSGCTFMSPRESRPRKICICHIRKIFCNVLKETNILSIFRDKQSPKRSNCKVCIVIIYQVLIFSFC